MSRKKFCHTKFVHFMSMALKAYLRQCGRCFYCGGSMDYSVCHSHRGRKKINPNGFTEDHLIPRSKGGARGWSNKVLCHYFCNQAKGDRMPTSEELDRFNRLMGVDH